MFLDGESLVLGLGLPDRETLGGVTGRGGTLCDTPNIMSQAHDVIMSPAPLPVESTI